MSNKQLELFEISEMDSLRGEIEKLKKELTNVRKGLFARHCVLMKSIGELQEEIEELKKEKSNIEDIKEA